ncbi:MAG TPA: isoprenylcysteine carboxylmethyltransferase family protein [Nitrospirota bacterium]|nr:isoprenylcysteine carboxylmethyltransferase family protein [Nitrospirota bacterium]
MIKIIIIFLIFAFIHSITVARWFKQSCNRALGITFMRVWYRFLYNAVSFISGAIAIYLIWQVPDRVLWEGPLWFRWTLHLIQIAGLAFGALAFDYLNAQEFLGFKQVWRYLKRGEVAGDMEGLTDRELVTTGVYGIVRHPMYLAGIIVFTFNPNITVNSLLITVLADLYFLFGVFIEERRFLKIFGEEYRMYMQHVPRLIPSLKKRDAR